MSFVGRIMTQDLEIKIVIVSVTELSTQARKLTGHHGSICRCFFRIPGTTGGSICSIRHHNNARRNIFTSVSGHGDAAPNFAHGRTLLFNCARNTRLKIAYLLNNRHDLPNGIN